MKSSPFSSPASRIGMTLGWSIEAATFDSRRKRSRKRSSSECSGQDQLERHRALERELLGPVDHPHVSAADHLLHAAPGEDRAGRQLGADRLRVRAAEAEARRAAAVAAGEGAEAAAEAVAAGAGAAARGRRGAPGRRGGAAAGGGGGSGGAEGACSEPVSSMVVSPTRIESPTLQHPGLAARARRSRRSRSPIRGPRCVSRPPASRTTRAWRRESSGSSASRPSPLTARPITSSSPSVSRRPLAGPAVRPTAARRRSARPARRGRPLPAAWAPERRPRRRSPAGPSGPSSPRRPGRASAGRRCARRSRTSRSPSPRSSIVSCPSAPREARAWRREISGSSPSLPASSGAARPMSSVGLHRQALAARVALGDPQLLARHRPEPYASAGRSRQPERHPGLDSLACARVQAAARRRPSGRVSARRAGWRSPPGTSAPLGTPEGRDGRVLRPRRLDEPGRDARLGVPAAGARPATSRR